jgi:hypothetical protein
MKYVFKQIDEYTPSEITVEFKADSMSTILEQFTLFLRGAGFYNEGVLDFIPFDDNLDDIDHSIHFFDEGRNK